MPCTGELQWDWRKVNTGKLPLISITDKHQLLIIHGGREFGRGTANDTSEVGVLRTQEEDYLELYI